MSESRKRWFVCLPVRQSDTEFQSHMNTGKFWFLRCVINIHMIPTQRKPLRLYTSDITLLGYTSCIL